MNLASNKSLSVMNISFWWCKVYHYDGTKLSYKHLSRYCFLRHWVFRYKYVCIIQVYTIFECGSKFVFVCKILPLKLYYPAISVTNYFICEVWTIYFISIASQGTSWPWNISAFIYRHDKLFDGPTFERSVIALGWTLLM